MKDEETRESLEEESKRNDTKDKRSELLRLLKKEIDELKATA